MRGVVQPDGAKFLAGVKSQRSSVKVREVQAEETAKAVLHSRKNADEFHLRPDRTRARTPECPRSRRPHSLRRRDPRSQYLTRFNSSFAEEDAVE